MQLQASLIGGEALSWSGKRPAPAPAATTACGFDETRCGIGFALFLLLNAVLFIRPAEIFPSLLGLPIYEVVIVACIAASWPVIVEQLSPAAIAARPGTLFVVALLPAIVLSHLSHGNTYDARVGAAEFLKVL